MKRWKFIVSILVAVAMITAVFLATPVLGPNSESPTVIAAGPTSFTLIAGQTNPAGTGYVSDNGTHLLFHIDPTCAITEMHVKVYSGTPTETNPSPGQFPNHFDYTSAPKTSGFDFAIPFIPNSPPPIYIALHAVVVCGIYESNTAWARDVGGAREFDGANWAEYFLYDTNS